MTVLELPELKSMDADAFLPNCRVSPQYLNLQRRYLRVQNADCFTRISPEERQKTIQSIKQSLSFDALPEKEKELLLQAEREKERELAGVKTP